MPLENGCDAATHLLIVTRKEGSFAGKVANATHDSLLARLRERGSEQKRSWLS